MNEIKTEIINRELSWIEFNTRVLSEAERSQNTLEERIRFLAITSENLDEFFSVRVARLIKTNSDKADLSGYTPKELERALYQKIKMFYQRQYACARELLRILRNRKIFVLRLGELNDCQKKIIYDCYCENIRPRFGERGRIKLICGNKIVDVPDVPRLLKIPNNEGIAYVLSEDIASYGIMCDRGTECIPIRLTQDEDFLVNDSNNMEYEVSVLAEKRCFGRVVRAEIEDLDNYPGENIYCVNGPVDLSFMREIELSSREEPEQRYEPAGDVFNSLKKCDKFMYHPYDSFKYVTDFIEMAAEDKNVTEIYQTIYRVSDNSPVIDALIKASENGKKVTVMVELKARFDEENNLKNSKRLKASGCKIIYGVCGLKIHCKVLRVVRCENGRNVAYVHLATGNYNEITAKGYTDMGYLSCREDFAHDTKLLFDSLEGREVGEYNKLVVSPDNLRGFLQEKIENEIRNAVKNLPCGIFIKVNSLSDAEIIRLLYKASSFGVPVKLIVRGICCLIPQKKGLSENIEVFSIVGRYLEHSRIFRFENGGDREILIGSADLMPRNLDRRIELIFPVEDDDIKQRIDKQIDIMLSDNTNLRVMDENGRYTLRKQSGKIINSQKELYKI